jgi:hypothetical protein
LHLELLTRAKARVFLATTAVDANSQLPLHHSPVVIWPVACSHLKQLAKDRVETGRHSRAGFFV